MSIIEVNHVTKEYRLGHMKSLKQSVVCTIDRLRGKPAPNQEPFKALDDIDFKVEEGEVLGIIGTNGAGKSTLLKLLARVSMPTKGDIKVRGSVAPLIEVGAGLHPELTGRENIFLNGSIMGLPRAVIKEKFDEKFLVLKGGDIRDQFGVNQWIEQNKVITSLDLAKRSEILPGLRQVHWDLIIVDEAHRMSWTPPARKTARYALGELLRDTADHFLLLTATPHKGDPKNFSLFLQLLDNDAYADVKSIHEAMDRRRAPFYLRRTKEAMVYFPERRPDGTWVAEKIFTKRIPHTVDFQIDGAEFDLYRDITRFVKRQSAKAAAPGCPEVALEAEEPIQLAASSRNHSEISTCFLGSYHPYGWLFNCDGGREKGYHSYRAMIQRVLQ